MKEIKEEKVKPKFDKGDWIIHQGTENIYQVVAIIDNQYQLKYGDNYTVQKCDDVDRHARLYITKENKELLLVDLCARLPYDVCVHIRYKEGEPCYGKLTPRDIQWFIDSKIEVIKPYLRPMSSMTEEEEKEFQKIKLSYHFDEDSYILLDWLNKKMFDYRTDDEGKTMIEKGLALEALEGMYNIKEQ